MLPNRDCIVGPADELHAFAKIVRAKKYFEFLAYDPCWHAKCVGGRAYHTFAWTRRIIVVRPASEQLHGISLVTR